MKIPKVVTISGGSGGFTLLRGLVQYPIDITSIATVFDSGGSTGILRDEYGALPQGDLRRCLLALIPNNSQWRQLFNHRFVREGFLEDHALGNLILLAAEEIYGRADSTRVLGEILGVRGRVLPVSVDDAHLEALLDDGTIIRTESEIDTRNILTDTRKIEKVWLTNPATACRDVVDAILSADFIIIGPGDLYTSLVPSLLVNGVAQAINRSPAKLIYVTNIMTKGAETRNYTVCDFLATLCEYGIARKFDHVVVAASDIPKELIHKYREAEHAELATMINDQSFTKYSLRYSVSSLYSEKAAKEGIIRHSSSKLGRVLMSIIESHGYEQCLIIDLDDTIAHTTRDMCEKNDRLKHLSLAKGALSFLLTFPGRRVLLSCGDSSLQRNKLHHLGIQGLFEEVIIVAKHTEKKEVISSHINDNLITEPQNVLIIGDRNDAELLYGKQLGCTTIQVCLEGGKYAQPTNTVADFSISSFMDLKECK